MVHVPSPYADAITDEYRLFQAQLEAGREGNREEKSRLIGEWLQARRRVRELAPVLT